MPVSVAQSLYHFLEACGADSEFRLEVARQDQRQTCAKSFALPFALVGRALQTDLTLNDSRVSPCHAYLQVIGGRVLCVDLQSRTGTHWPNGPRRCGWLDHDSFLGIGPFRLSTRGVSADRDLRGRQVNPLAAQTNGDCELPAVSLEFLNGITAQRLWRLTPVLTLVGQAAPCQIRLRGDSVSRFHCSLVRTPAGLWVVDLLGRGGVLVNQRRVRWACLEDGDRLQIGRFRTRVCFDDAPPMVHWPQPRNGNGWREPDRAPSAALVATTKPALPSDALKASEPLVWHLVDQFTQMQQHMFDQFQQATLMMVQMFGALHKEQFALIQKELDRLHELSQELHTLQRELRQQGLPIPAITAAFTDSLPQVHDLTPFANPFVGAPAAPRGPSSIEVARPAPEAPAPEAPRAGTAQPVPEASAPEAATTPATSAAPAPSTQSEAELHKWLSERFSAIEKERQSSWQRIMGFLKGKRGDESVP